MQQFRLLFERDQHVLDVVAGSSLEVERLVRQALVSGIVAVWFIDSLAELVYPSGMDSEYMRLATRSTSANIASRRP